MDCGYKKGRPVSDLVNQQGNYNMHYFKFNIGDYAKATRHLNNLEDLAYRRLIELYYDTEKPLPNDVKKLARLINMRENTEEIDVVLSDFFNLTNDGFQQKRIDEEITDYHRGADTARANGKKGGRPKKANPNPDETQGKPKKTQRVNLANPDETGLKANQEPLTNNHKPVTTKQSNKNFCQLVADEYNKILGDVLPGAKAISDKRVGLVNGTVKQFKDSDKDFSDIRVWNQYFNFVRESEFLMNGSGNWTANFEFLINKNNVLKAREGNYHNDN